MNDVSNEQQVTGCAGESYWVFRGKLLGVQGKLEDVQGKLLYVFWTVAES